MSTDALSRRKFLQFSAMMAVGTVMAACAPAVAPGASSGAPAAETKTVSFMSIGNESEQEMFQNALDVLMEQPAIKDAGITVEWQPDPGGGWDKIMAMFASDTAYDVQRIDDDRVASLALNNKIHQLDCLMELYEMNVDDYYPLFWQTLNLGGYQFCMNPAGGANVLYFNQTLFEEAGLDLPPTTWADAWEWDEFLGIAEKLGKKDASGKPTQYVLGFPFNIISPVAYGAGGAFLNEQQTECTMSDPAVVDMVQQFVDLTVQGGPEYFVPPGLDLLELFNAGRLALAWASMGWQNLISQDITWDICPWMKTPKYAMTENYDRTFVLSKTAPDHEAAFLVLKTLCEQPAVDVFAKYKFGVPYFRVSAEGPAFYDGSNPVNKQVWLETFGEVNGQRIDVPTPRGPADAFKNVFTEEKLFGAALAGQMSAQQFLDDGCVQAIQPLKEINWEAGQFEARLVEAGVVTCEGTKIWPDTDWP